MLITIFPYIFLGDTLISSRAPFTSSDSNNNMGPPLTAAPATTSLCAPPPDFATPVSVTPQTGLYGIPASSQPLDVPPPVMTSLPAGPTDGLGQALAEGVDCGPPAPGLPPLDVATAAAAAMFGNNPAAASNFNRMFVAAQMEAMRNHQQQTPQPPHQMQQALPQSTQDNPMARDIAFLGKFMLCLHKKY